MVLKHNSISLYISVIVSLSNFRKSSMSLFNISIITATASLMDIDLLHQKKFVFHWVIHSIPLFLPQMRMNLKQQLFLSKGCVHYFRAYNSLQVAAIIILCNFILCFCCLYHCCLAHFQPRDNWKKHSFEEKIIAEIILVTYVNALTQTRSYWKYSILIMNKICFYRLFC